MTEPVSVATPEQLQRVREHGWYRTLELPHVALHATGRAPQQAPPGG